MLSVLPENAESLWYLDYHQFWLVRLQCLYARATGLALRATPDAPGANFALDLAQAELDRFLLPVNPGWHAKETAVSGRFASGYRPSMTSLRPKALACVAAAMLHLAAVPGMLHAATRSAPTDILTGIYREAVKGATSDWLDPNRRDQYLSKSLAALWATADAKKPPEGEVGAIDFDLTTDTNALELERFNIRTEEITGSTARLAVSLDYKKPYVRKGPAILTYDFVRENGRWRIDNIRTDKWSVRDLLTRWLKDP